MGAAINLILFCKTYKKKHCRKTSKKKCGDTASSSITSELTRLRANRKQQWPREAGVNWPSEWIIWNQELFRTAEREKRSDIKGGEERGGRSDLCPPPDVILEKARGGPS